MHHTIINIELDYEIIQFIVQFSDPNGVKILADPTIQPLNRNGFFPDMKSKHPASSNLPIHPNAHIVWICKAVQKI